MKLTASMANHREDTLAETVRRWKDLNEAQSLLNPSSKEKIKEVLERSGFTSVAVGVNMKSTAIFDGVKFEGLTIVTVRHVKSGHVSVDLTHEKHTILPNVD